MAQNHSTYTRSSLGNKPTLTVFKAACDVKATTMTLHDGWVVVLGGYGVVVASSMVEKQNT